MSSFVTDDFTGKKLDPQDAVTIAIELETRFFPTGVKPMTQRVSWTKRRTHDNMLDDPIYQAITKIYGEELQKGSLVQNSVKKRVQTEIINPRPNGTKN